MSPHRIRPVRASLAVTVALAGVLAAALAARAPAGRAGRAAPLALVATLAGGAHETRRANRLVHEKSPYLRQHAYNPVDWYPWGEEAFARARAEDKPIFLSIGYSTCHWCHVMERESFEDDSIAAVLNRGFVCIKVDREERPDVDRVYMSAMQAFGLGGGWPLNVFLTPDLEPFYGGTYFPPRSLPGRPGLLELLPRVAEAWRTRRAELVASGARVFAALDSLAAPPPGAAAAGYGTLADACERHLERACDAAHGGFGGAPKFPSTANLDFLLRRSARDPAAHARARDMALRQLDAMAAGGIHDVLGGGFHRYATDAEWLVPHFEKMLYDQALIADACLDAVAPAPDPRRAEVARGVFAYVARDLTSPAGAFYSAEDADSDGGEGRFYVWTPAQLAAALGADDARLFAYAYGVTPQGNFEHGASVLHAAHPAADVAKAFGLGEAETGRRLAGARATLLAARDARPRPRRDDKVIAAWNGLMIAACAHGARVLGDPALAAQGVRAATFAWDSLRVAGADGADGLRRRWCDGEAAGEGQLDDYAFLARGFLELFGATHDPVWLARAEALARGMLARFWDARDGGFFESPAGDASVRVRMKDGYDGAEPAGNSIAVEVLLRLASLLDRPEWHERAGRTLDYYARRLADAPWAMPRMLVAMDLASRPGRQVVIAGARAAADTRALVAEFDREARPGDELVVVDDGDRAALAALAPFTASLRPQGGRATAYVCVDRACRLPVSDPVAFAAQLAEPTAERPR